jgi:hypothetical protein
MGQRPCIIEIHLSNALQTNTAALGWKILRKQIFYVIKSEQQRSRSDRLQTNGTTGEADAIIRVYRNVT